MRYYLAMDIGTTNWKVAIFNEKGILQAIERTPTQTHTDEKGHSYYDPKELWRAMKELSRKVTAKVGKPIAAISVTSIAEAIVGIDEQGNPVDHIITWFDTRSMKQADYLKEKLGKEKLFSITGLDVNPIFSLPKILWMRENRPQSYEKVKVWLQMADYLLFCLTKEYVTDYTLASRTLALDIKTNQWSKEILQALDIPVCSLPTIQESGTVIGTISEEISKVTGITKGAKVVVGGNDHPCASIAAGAVDGSKILDSSGTAESFIYISKKGAIPKMIFQGQRTCRYLEKDRYALWGGIIASGRSFDWAYELFTSSKCWGITQSPYTYEQILSQIENVKGMESGLIYYPHLRGAGAPYWNPKISGSFVGMRDYHGAPHMLKSVLEGLCMQARMIVEMEEKLAGQSVKRLCVVGGSSHNKQWQQIKANVTQKEIELCYEAEATALGAAMEAAIGDGIYQNIEEVSRVIAAKNVVIYPEEKQVKKYELLYPLYSEGYKAMEAFNERIYEVVNTRE